MTNPSDEILSSLDFNDSDIEKEFNHIKATGQKTAPGDLQSAKLFQGSGLGEGPGPGPGIPVGLRVPQISVQNRSPKPIPKGIDFGHELIGNPRFFSKNNTNITGQHSDDFLSSDNENMSGGHDSAESYQRMPNKQMFEMKTEAGDMLSPDYSDDSSRHSLGGDFNKTQVPNNKERDKRTEAKRSAEREVDFDKYQELTQSEIYARKEEILLELEKLREKGVRMEKEYNISSDLSEMERTYMRLKNKKDQTSAMKLMKKVLMGMVSGTEFINQRYNKENVDLEGWTENVLINISDYDEIFEELYDKYKTKFAVAPEIKLLMTIFGSAFTFHMSKVLAKQFAPAAQNGPIDPNLRDNKRNEKMQEDARPWASFEASNQNQNVRQRPKVPVATYRTAAEGSGATMSAGSTKGRITTQLADIFGANEKKPMKGNDELDDIIREIEYNQNNLSLPEEETEGYDEILSDSQANETADLNEIQEGKNLIL